MTLSTIFFATSSAGKFEWLQRAIITAGLSDVLIERRSLDLIEIQSASLGEISAHKARQAWEMLKQPVLVMDGGFYINALNGFPGPYGSHMIGQMGVENIAKLAGVLTDRRFTFQNVVTFMDGPNRVRQFTDTTGDVYTLATQAWPQDHPKQWSSIWRVAIPSGFGFDKPLAAFSEDDLHEYDARLKNISENPSALHDFVQYLIHERQGQAA